LVHVDIKPESTAVIVHDVVNDFIDPEAPGYDPALSSVLDNIVTLLASARRAAIPVIFIGPGQGDPAIGPSYPLDEPPSRLAWGSPGCDVPSMLGQRPSEPVVRKPRWGGFYGSELADYLHEGKRDTLMICGLSLPGGVDWTVRDAFNHDLKSVVVVDACLTRPIEDQGWGALEREEVRRVVLSILAHRFARVMNTAEACAELRGLVGAGSAS
jgi:nicotinamidase-related amidase